MTALVRKIYLSAIALKPHIKISAATIARASAPRDVASWQSGLPYREALQDWRAWMEEGILDINMPMVYTFHNPRRETTPFSQWSSFAVQHRYNRHAVISPALYMNTVGHSIAQIELARKAGANGVCLYSYAFTSITKAPRKEFVADLTRGNQKERFAAGFADSVRIPEMPWKINPTTGHLKGFVLDAGSQAMLDGAHVEIAGPVKRSVISDATGFYGSVDLPPGEYSLTTSMVGRKAVTKSFFITAGKVSTIDVALGD